MEYPRLQAKPLVPLFLTIFTDLLGMGIVIPVLAAVFLDPAGGIFDPSVPFATRALYLGLVTAAYPLAQFFGAPIFGALSDRHGRKPILAISIIGTAVSLALFAIAVIIHSLPLMFVARLLDGFTGGNISVAQSALADMSTPKTKARNFALIGIAFGLGFILGPVAGGKFSDPSLVSWFSYSVPFWVASLLSVLNAVSLSVWFKETLRERREARVSLWTGFRNLRQAWRMDNLRLLFATVLFYYFGFSFFTQFYQVFLIEKFGFTEGDVGNMFGYIGLLIAAAQVALVRPLSKRHRPQAIFSIAPVLLAAGFMLLLVPDTAVGLYLMLLAVALPAGLAMPNLTAIVSEQAGDDSQGEIMGINQSVNAIAQTIPPVIAGIIASISVSLPIIVAGGATLIAWAIFFFGFRRAKREVFHEA